MMILEAGVIGFVGGFLGGIVSLMIARRLGYPIPRIVNSDYFKLGFGFIGALISVGFEVSKK